MLRINQNIIINGKTLPFCNTCIIESSRNNFTDTAEVQINNKISANGKKISDVIGVGSEITIQLGYFPYLVTEFEGYVSQIIPEKKAIIQCENESYMYKRESIGKDIILKSTNVKKIIDEIYTGNSNVLDSNVGDWFISRNSTLIDVLSELQSKFKIYSYFRGKTLIVGASAEERTKQTVKADFHKNIPLGESSFNFKQSENDRIIVKATAIQRDGTIKTIYAYYEGNPQHIVFSKVKPNFGAINEFNINGRSDFSEDDLKELAEIRLEALSFTGVDGSVMLYGRDFINGNYESVVHGDICEIKDSQIPEKNGNYSIVGVTKSFGVGIGYRQDLHLGLQL